MEYREFQLMVKAAGRRSLRYYACAVASEVKELGKSGSIIKAIAFGEQIAAGKESWHGNYDIRKLCEQLKNLASNQDNFERRTAREVALLCVEPDVVKTHFETVINAVRQFRGKHFDDDIHDCIRPEYVRKSVGTKHQHLRAMAHKMHDEEDWQTGIILADACDELNILQQDAWDHLRKDLHWRGCWVIDDLLGSWGA